jgi:DNA-binding NtrC family response regulator
VLKLDTEITLPNTTEMACDPQQPNFCTGNGLPVARTRTRHSKSLIVLVVEDDENVRVLTESNIAELGHDTLSAANGTEALALLAESIRITLLFTDINMPDGPDGLELARRAVELRPELRVLYTSGGGQADGMTALFVEGSIFLPKPYTREQLMEAVRDVMRPPTARPARSSPR